MPHQCTECGRVFADGSKEMLSGCPDCGGNTFQFKPSMDDASPDDDRPDPPDPPDGNSAVSETVSRATRTVREWVRDRSGEDDRAGRPTSDQGKVGGSPSDTEPSNVSREPSSTGSKPGRTSTAESDDRPDLTPTEEEGYPAWPNPDGADTSGVGKGPGARRERQDRELGSTSYERKARRQPGAEDGNDSPGSTTDDRPEADRPDEDEFEWNDDPALHGSSAASDRNAPRGSESGRDAGAEPDSEPDPEPTWETDGIHARPDDHEDDAQAMARSDMVTPDELPDPPAGGGVAPEDRSSEPPDRSPESSDGRSEPPGGPLESPAEPPRSGGDSSEPDGDDRQTVDHSPAGDEFGPARPPGDRPDRVPSEGQVVDTPASEDRPDLDELREELNDQFESIKIVSQGQYELNLMELYDRDEYIISLREDGRYVIDVAESWRNDE